MTNQKGEQKLNLQNINIENKTEEQFAIMVRKLMKQVTDFIERGENELGFKIDYMTAINIEDNTGEGIHSLQTMKTGHNLLEQSLLITTENRQRYFILRKSSYKKCLVKL